MRSFNRRQLALDTAKAVGITVGWTSLWIGVLWVAGRGSDFLLWPLGIILGALLQKAMLELRLRAVDRQLLTHPRLNDWVGDWIFTRMYLARLTTERARLLAGEEALQEFSKEEKDWLRMLGPHFLVLSGFQRLLLLDHQSKWASRLRHRNKLPPITRRTLAQGIALGVGVIAVLATTNAFVEFFLFGALPYFFITPYWETRLFKAFAENRSKNLANWRRA